MGPITQYTLLFFAALIAALISGVAAFGGALLLLPILIAIVGTASAIPILTIAQLIGNAARAGFGFASIRWKLVGPFLIGAVPGAIIGARLFIELPPGLVNRFVGIALLVFVVLTISGKVTLKAGWSLLVVGGMLTGFISGLVGSAGPLGAAIFLSLGLPPVAYVASEAVTALSMHAVKTAIYSRYVPLDKNLWLLAVIVGAAMILGTYLAKRVMLVAPQRRIRQFVSLLLIAVALYMIIRG